jgi:hypothetical protein
VFSTIVNPKSAGNCLFSAPFFCILASFGAYLPVLTSSTTAPCPGTSPANIRRTKQFMSRLHDL